MFVLVLSSEALLVPLSLFPLSWNPIDRTVDVAISNDLILPSNPPVTIDVPVAAAASDDEEEPAVTANDNSGPDSMLCVSTNGLVDDAVSWTRTAPSQLVEANSFFPSLFDNEEAGRY
jgi:hypothetical protein